MRPLDPAAADLLRTDYHDSDTHGLTIGAMSQDSPTGNLLELALAQSERRPNTMRNYRTAVRSFVDYAGRDPARWTGARVTEWRNELAKTMSARSVNVRLAAVRFASKRACALGHLDRDFASAADKLGVVIEKRRAAVPVEVARTILATCAGTTPIDVRDRALLTLGFYHGMRRESLAHLTVEDLDFIRGQLTFIIKGGRRHTAPFDPDAQGAVHAWIACCLDVEDAPLRGPLFRVCRRTVDDQWHITTPMSTNAIYKVVRQRAAAAGVTRFHPHLMRHCFISWAIEHGHSIEEIMRVTGHRNPSSVQDYVSEVRGLGTPPKRLNPKLAGDT